MAQADPYLIPGTRILKNRLGAATAEALAKLEHEITAVRIEQLHHRPLAGNYDYRHLQAMHAHIFSDLYEWAGRPRTIGIVKPEPLLNGKTVDYPHPSGRFPADNLASRARYAFDQLSRANCLKGLARDTFVDQCAEHFSAIWQTHPFRDGNTRATLELFRQLAKAAGHPLRQTLSDTPGALRDALVLSAAGRGQPLKQRIAKAITPLRHLHEEVESLKSADPAAYDRITGLKAAAWKRADEHRAAERDKIAFTDKIVNRALAWRRQKRAIPALEELSRSDLNRQNGK